MPDVACCLGYRCLVHPQRKEEKRRKQASWSRFPPCSVLSSRGYLGESCPPFLLDGAFLGRIQAFSCHHCARSTGPFRIHPIRGASHSARGVSGVTRTPSFGRGGFNAPPRGRGSSRFRYPKRASNPGSVVLRRVLHFPKPGFSHLWKDDIDLVKVG